MVSLHRMQIALCEKATLIFRIGFKVSGLPHCEQMHQPVTIAVRNGHQVSLVTATSTTMADLSVSLSCLTNEAQHMAKYRQSVGLAVLR